MPVFLLVLLLFWQKQKLNTLIMFHIVVTMTLYARAFVLSPSHWGVDNSENAVIFDIIYHGIRNFVFCFCIVWIYQWWYIGKRRSELQFE